MLYMEPYVPRLPCYHHTHSWAGEKRSRTRAIQLSAHRACLHGDEQCKKLFRAARTHETRNLAAPRRARPRPGLPASSSPRTPAHRARRCARTAAPRRGGGGSARRPEAGRPGHRFPTARRFRPVRDRLWRRPSPCAVSG